MTRHRVDGHRRRRHIRRVFRPVDARPRRDGCREATHRSSQSGPCLDPCLPQAAPSGSSSPPPSSTRRRRRTSSSSAPPRASTPSPPPSPRRALEASHRARRPHTSRPHLSATSLGNIRPHASALARPCLSAAGAPSLHVGFVTHAPATESATAEWCYPLDAAEQLPSTDQRINAYSRHVI